MLKRALASAVLAIALFFLSFLPARAQVTDSCVMHVQELTGGNFLVSGNSVLVDGQRVNDQSQYGFYILIGGNDRVSIPSTSFQNGSFAIEIGADLITSEGYTVFRLVKDNGVFAHEDICRVQYDRRINDSDIIDAEGQIIPDEVAAGAALLSDFDYCLQVPDDGQRAACNRCLDSATANEGKVYTAVGCLGTSGSGLAGDLISLMLGLAGGVSLLTILVAAFTFSTSQGDTNKVKKAKELMTAAVSGLLFIIFSIIILNFVGVSLLRIPGLSGGLN